MWNAEYNFLPLHFVLFFIKQANFLCFGVFFVGLFGGLCVCDFLHLCFGFVGFFWQWKVLKSHFPKSHQNLV